MQSGFIKYFELSIKYYEKDAPQLSQQINLIKSIFIDIVI